MYGLPKSVCVVPVIPMSSFHMFCLCFCMSEVISSFRSLRAGSQVFALLMLFLCDFAYYVFGQEPTVNWH